MQKAYQAVRLFSIFSLGLALVLLALLLFVWKDWSVIPPSPATLGLTVYPAAFPCIFAGIGIFGLACLPVMRRKMSQFQDNTEKDSSGDKSR